MLPLPSQHSHHNSIKPKAVSHNIILESYTLYILLEGYIIAVPIVRVASLLCLLPLQKYAPKLVS